MAIAWCGIWSANHAFDGKSWLGPVHWPRYHVAASVNAFISINRLYNDYLVYVMRTRWPKSFSYHESVSGVSASPGCCFFIAPGPVFLEGNLCLPLRRSAMRFRVLRAH